MNSPLGRSGLSVKAQGSAPEMRRKQTGPSPGLGVRELPRGSKWLKGRVSVKGGNAGMKPRTMGKRVDET